MWRDPIGDFVSGLKNVKIENSDFLLTFNFCFVFNTWLFWWGSPQERLDVYSTDVQVKWKSLRP